MLFRAVLVIFMISGSNSYASNNPICSNNEYMNSDDKKGCMELDISEAQSCNNDYNISHHGRKTNNITWSNLKSGCSRITRERWKNSYHKVFETRLLSTNQDQNEVAYLTYHHQGGGNGGNGTAISVYTGIHATHTSDKSWGDVAYHYMIDRFGNIIEARDLDYSPNSGTKGRGSSGREGNYHYPKHFAVMFAGNFHNTNQRPQLAAIVSAARVLSAAQLKFKLGASSIKPHDHYSPLGTGKPGWGTTCPGKNFEKQHHDKLVRLTTAMSIQTTLRKRGCLSGEVDGIIGKNTRNAILRLEAFAGDLPSHSNPAKLLEALFAEDSVCQKN